MFSFFLERDYNILMHAALIASHMIRQVFGLISAFLRLPGL